MKWPASWRQVIPMTVVLAVLLSVATAGPRMASIASSGHAVDSRAAAHLASQDAATLEVADIATSTALPGVILVSFSGSQVPMYSLDGGQCWYQVQRTPWVGEDMTTPLAVALAPRYNPEVPARFLVAAPGMATDKVGVYRTGHYGWEWAFHAIPIDSHCNEPTYFPVFAASPVDPDRLYLPSYCHEAYYVGVARFPRMFTSPDGGINWQRVANDIGGIGSYTRPSPVVADRVYIHDGSGDWWQSDNGGQDWELKDFPVSQLALDANNAQWLYGVGGDVKRSSDGGDTWTSGQHPCVDHGIYSSKLVAHPTVSEVLFMLCHEEGLYRSQDGGDSWEQLSLGYDWQLVPDLGDPGRLLWARDDGLWASDDQGTTWSQLVSDWNDALCYSLFVPIVLRER